LGAKALTTNLGAKALTTNLGAKAPITNLGAKAAITNLGAKAPTTNLGAKAPLTNLGTKAPLTNLGTKAPTTNLGAKAPTTNLGAKAPTTNLGAKAPTTNLGAKAPTTNYKRTNGTKTMSAFQLHQKNDKLNSGLAVKTTSSETSLRPITITSTEAEFIRVGFDLVIKSPSDSLFISDYFINHQPLQTASGTILSADNVTTNLKSHTEPLLLAANGTANVITASNPQKIGTITATVEGPVTALDKDGTSRILNEGAPVYLHDTLVTSARSYVKIILNDGTVFQLGPHSRASLDKYAYDPDIGGGEFESYVYSGAFRYLSGKLGGNNQGQHTTLKTPSAQIGIRGSEIDAIVGEDGSTTLLHLSGLVSIISRHNPREIIVYERGTSVYVPNENISHTIEQRTEEHIQQRNQEWQEVFRGSKSVEDNISGAPNFKTPESATPVKEDATSSSEEGVRNPFSPDNIDVHSDESVDDIVSEIEEQKSQEPLSDELDISPIELNEDDNETGNDAITAERTDEEDEITNGHTERPHDDESDTAHLDNDNKPRDDDTEPSGDGTEPAENGNEPSDDDTEPAENGKEPSDDDTESADDDTQANETVLERTLNEDNSQIIQVLSADSGEITQLAQPSHGKVVENGDGTLTYTPTPNFNGQDNFTYTLNNTNTVLVKLTITPINDAPVALDDSFTLAPNTPLDISTESLLNNDQDVDGDTLQIVEITNPQNSTFNLLDNGNIELTLENDVTTAGFDYIISDGDKTDIGHVTLRLARDNPPPTANDNNVSINSIAPVTNTAHQSLDNTSAPISEASQDGVDTKLAGNDVQLFINRLINDNFDAATFDHTITNNNSSLDTATATVKPTNAQSATSENDTLEGTDKLDIILNKEDNNTSTTNVAETLLRSNDAELQGIEKIDRTGDNNQQRLSINDVLDISDTNRLVIEGDTTVNPIGQGWNSLDPSGLYHHYTGGAEELLISVEMTNNF